MRETTRRAEREPVQFFLAVIYCTEAFMTPAQLASELSTKSVPDNWRFLLVTGRGERRKKKDSPAKGPVAAAAPAPGAASG